jgi:hypothetical protein
VVRSILTRWTPGRRLRRSLPCCRVAMYWLGAAGSVEPFESAAQGLINLLLEATK